MSLESEPFITVIMPCYNGDRHLEKALEAFFSQDYQNKKLVVVDGKSTDHSHFIIAGYIEKGFPIFWDKYLDTGISSAINIGLRYLKESDIFGYLGSDDILMPNILSEVAYIFGRAPEVDGLYFDSYSYSGETGKLSYRACPTSEFTLNNLLKIGTIVGLQNIYIRGAHVAENRFSESNKYSMDYDLYLRLLMKKALNFSHIRKPSSINLMYGNISTTFSYEGALEAISVAVNHVGYRPILLLRLLLLKLVKLKNAISRSL